MSGLLLIFLALVLGSLSTVDPLYPPYAVSGGTVVAEVHFAKGAAASVAILSGEEPFAGSCRSALAKWRMNSGQDAHELVVVHFRQPFLAGLGSKAQEQILSSVKPQSPLPFPKSVVEPAYPPNALGQGSVVLRVNISAEGRVAATQTIKSLGILTDCSVDAVRKWEFVPLRDRAGKKIPSHAYAVLVFRFPVLFP